jgi:hypothetical protein
MIRTNFGTKVVAATTAQTVSFNNTDLWVPGSNVFRVLLAATGANNHLTSAVNRLRVKASAPGVLGTVWDVLPIQLRRMMERLGRANQLPVAADLRYQIPLFVPDGKGDERYAAGFPVNAIPTVEVQTDATSSAGTLRAAWEEDKDIKPAFYSVFLSQQGNVPASQTNARVTINQPGLLRGISLPLVSATGITRVQLYINGEQVWDADQNAIINCQDTEDPGANITGVPTHLFHKFRVPFPIIGNSYLLVDTGAASAAADEYAFYSLVPQAA